MRGTRRGTSSLTFCIFGTRRPQKLVQFEFQYSSLWALIAVVGLCMLCLEIAISIQLDRALVYQMDLEQQLKDRNTFVVSVPPHVIDWRSPTAHHKCYCKLR